MSSGCCMILLMMRNDSDACRKRARVSAICPSGATARLESMTLAMIAPVEMSPAAKAYAPATMIATETICWMNWVMFAALAETCLMRSDVCAAFFESSRQRRNR